MRDFISHHAKIATNAADKIDVAMSELKQSLKSIVGILRAYDDFDTAIPVVYEYADTGNGFDDTLELVNQMIIKLNIKGSVRIRPNCLIELRTPAFGSIYGRTIPELERKLTAKIKENKQQAKQKKSKVPTLSEFYNDIYLPKKQQTVAPNTLRSINRSFNTVIDGGLDIPLDKLKAADIEKFLLTIEKTRTRQIVRCFINNLLGYAKQLEITDRNACDNVSKVKHVEQTGEALSFDEQKDFFKTLYTAANIPINKKLYYTFVYLTGTRRSEAIAVRTVDVDFEKNVLHIPGTKTRTSDRDIPLFPLAKALLQKIKPTSQGRFFTLEQAKATQVIKKVTTEHHLHELRHTFGTIAVCVKKLDAKTVAMFMGHADATMTLNIYTHPEQLDKALFFDGSISDNEKLERLRRQYDEVLQIITDFLDSVPTTVPTF